MPPSKLSFKRWDYALDRTHRRHYIKPMTFKAELPFLRIWGRWPQRQWTLQFGHHNRQWLGFKGDGGQIKRRCILLGRFRLLRGAWLCRARARRRHWISGIRLPQDRFSKPNPYQWWNICFVFVVICELYFFNLKMLKICTCGWECVLGERSVWSVGLCFW